jgi:hypothetical protein
MQKVQGAVGARGKLDRKIIRYHGKAEHGCRTPSV